MTARHGRMAAAAAMTAALVVALAACSSGTTATTTTATTAGAAPIDVAVEGPLTGPQAATGTDMVRGGQLAAARINAAGGVLGRKIRIVPANDRADPTAGASVAHGMVDAHVAAVIGPFNSSVGLTALPVYQKAGVSILRMTSAVDTEGYGITTQPMANQIAPVESQEITQVIKAPSVAVLFDPSTYTAGIANELVDLLRGQGVKVLVDQPLPPTSTPAQVSAELARVSATAPALTYLAMYGAEAGLVVKTMSGAPSSTYGKCLVDLAAQGPDYVAAAGPSASTMCEASGVPPTDELPGGPAYVTAYAEAYHRTPGTWGAFVYDSLGIWAKAVTASHQISGSKVRAALASTTGYSGVTGLTTIQAKTGNRLNPPVVILQITPSGAYTVDAAWAVVSGYGTNGTTTTTAPTTTTTVPKTTTTTTVPKTTTSTTGHSTTTTTTVAPTTTTTTVPPTTTTATTA